MKPRVTAIASRVAAKGDWKWESARREKQRTSVNKYLYREFEDVMKQELWEIEGLPKGGTVKSNWRAGATEVVYEAGGEPVVSISVYVHNSVGMSGVYHLGGKEITVERVTSEPIDIEQRLTKRFIKTTVDDLFKEFVKKLKPKVGGGDAYLGDRTRVEVKFTVDLSEQDAEAQITQALTRAFGDKISEEIRVDTEEVKYR